MIEARLPDGTSLQFPDGTADSVIDQTVAGHVQASAPPPDPSIGRGLGLGTRDVLTGVSSLPSALLDLATWPGRAIQRAAGIPTTAPSDLVQSGIDALGLPQPQTPIEKGISTFNQGAASLLPTMGAGAIPALQTLRYAPLVNALSGDISTPAKIAQQAVIGGTAPEGGEALASVAPESLKPTARALGTVGTAATTGKVMTGIGKVVNAVSGVTSPTVAAYDRLNMTPRLIGDVGGGATGQSLQAYSSAAPISSAVVAPVERQAVSEFGNAVEGTAAMLGASRNATAAGSVLQQEARDWKDTVFPQREAQAWAPVDQAMQNATVDPANYRASLTALTGKLAALPETQKALLPSRVTTMLDAINADVPPGATMPWQQAQNLRSAIGSVMGVPEIVNEVGTDALKKAYGGISEDMRTSANANGAAQQFANANAVSTAGHSFIENTLSKVIKANNPAQESITPGQAADTILGSGDTHLQAIRQEMPRAADELAAYKLRDMALATPGKAGATGGETSVATFLTDLNRFRQAAPNGADALFADPDVQQRVRDLSTVADSMRETAARANVSRTGAYMSLAGLVPMAMEGYAHGGIKGAGAAVAAPLAANRLLGSAVTNEPLTRFAATPSPTLPINPLLAGAISDLPGQQRGSR